MNLKSIFLPLGLLIFILFQSAKLAFSRELKLWYDTPAKDPIIAGELEKETF
ncbi:MAG: hypothetical protein U0T82_04075 [Bacteroidales bacterium]